MDSEARLSFDPLSVSTHWSTRLSSVRLPVPVDEVDVDAERLDGCHRKFRDISQRTRALWKRPEFQPDGVPRIMRLGEESLSLSRMICDELVAHTVNAGIFLPIPLDVLEELLAANSVMLDWLTERMDAVAVYAPLAAHLKNVVEGITSGRQKSSRELRALTMDFIAAVANGPILMLHTAVDARAQFDILSPAGDSRSGWFAQGMLAASFLTRTMSKDGAPTESSQRLAMSALVQDLGGWWNASLLTPKLNDPRESIPRLPPYHPSTGATMLSGLADTPAEVAMMVGAHHERCDGSGFPQRLSGSRFSSATQRLAWAVRFAELVLDPLTAACAVESGDALDTVAGTRLWREVVRGAFDQHAVRDWFHAIRPGLVDEILSLFPKHQRRFVDLAHRQIPAPHSQTARSNSNSHDAVPKPQFLRRGRRTISGGVPIANRRQEGRPS